MNPNSSRSAAPRRLTRSTAARRGRRFSILIAMVCTALIVAAVPASAVGSVAYPPGVRVGGESLSRLAHRNFQWIVTATGDRSPFNNPDACRTQGEANEDVAFLPPPVSVGEVSHCTLDAGQDMLVTPAGSFCFSADVEPGQTLPQCASTGWPPISQSIVVDGTPVTGLSAYAIASGVLPVYLKADNPFGKPAGPDTYAFIGTFAVLRAMRPGTHQVQLTADAGPGGQFSSTIIVTVRRH